MQLNLDVSNVLQSLGDINEKVVRLASREDPQRVVARRYTLGTPEALDNTTIQDTCTNQSTCVNKDTCTSQCTCTNEYACSNQDPCTNLGSCSQDTTNLEMEDLSRQASPILPIKSSVARKRSTDDLTGSPMSEQLDWEYDEMSWDCLPSTENDDDLDSILMPGNQ